MMKKSIILIGGGGHCLSCIDVLEQLEEYEIKGILDHQLCKEDNVQGYPILGNDSLIEKYAKQGFCFLITVGQIRSSTIRERLLQQVKTAGGQLPVIISPTAYVSKNATIGKGSIVMHHACINAGAKVGIGAIINTKALIEHESTVGDYCHISTGVILNGQVEVGDNCFIGSNTVVSNNITIVEDTIISAGSQVLRNVTLSGVYLGFPLKKIR